MLLKNRCIRKLKFFALSCFLVACAERPVYEPTPNTATPGSGPQKSSTAKAGTAANPSEKTADASNSMTPNTDAAPTVMPTPTPTPTPAPPAAAPAEPVGVAATGRTLVMQTCIAVGCHGTSPINAKTDAELALGMNIAAHPAAVKAGNYFTKPAAGTAANNFSHVLAYLKANPTTPIMGPNIP
jgi:hypothetical protein